MPICTTPVSLCGIIISVWGCIQLALMGFFYMFHSLALAEDLPGLEGTFKDPDDFFNEAIAGYSKNAMNCWIAALLYLITLLFSVHQFYLNSRNSISI